MKSTRLILLTIFMLLLAACDAVSPAPEPTPTPTPQELLSQGVSLFTATESFHFDLVLENRALAADSAGLLSFNEASGDVRPPDSMRASTVVQSAFGNLTIGFVAIADEQWLTNPLDGSWQAVPPEAQTNIALMFDAQQGLGAALARLDNLERLPDESVNGVNTVHLRGSLAADTLVHLAPELAESGDLTVEIYFAADSLLLERVIIAEPPVEGETPTWTFDFDQHNAAPEITPPL